MTIHQYLRRLASQYVGRLMLFLIVGGILMALAPAIFALRFAGAVVMLVVVLATVVHLFRIPCPRCREPLGRIGFMAAHAARSDGRAQCPHCAVSLDSEMPQEPS
jgi:hypothetical protein